MPGPHKPDAPTKAARYEVFMLAAGVSAGRGVADPARAHII